MREIGIVEVLITALLTSGFVTGIFTLVTKKVWSPESKNELARLGSEFAQQLLRDAKSEREELRLTIRELQETVSIHHKTIDRLEHLAKAKDKIIAELEERQFKMAEKLRQGLPITLIDIFGDDAPDGFTFIDEEVV